MPKSSLFTMPTTISFSSFSRTFSGALSTGCADAVAFLTGFGRARLFTFWFWFSGMRSICIVTAGTI